jgi:hypothetical protein
MKPSEVVMAPAFGILVTFLLTSNLNCQSCAAKPDWCAAGVGLTGEACRTVFGFAALAPGPAAALSLAIGVGLALLIKAFNSES